MARGGGGAGADRVDHLLLFRIAEGGMERQVEGFAAELLGDGEWDLGGVVAALVERRVAESGIDAAGVQVRGQAVAVAGLTQTDAIGEERVPFGGFGIDGADQPGEAGEVLLVTLPEGATTGLQAVEPAELGQGDGG